MGHKGRARQEDIQRAIRAAQKTGAKRVRVTPDGSIDIVLDDDHIGRLPDRQPVPPEEEELELYPGKLRL